MQRSTLLQFARAQTSSVFSTACDFLTTAVLYRLIAHVAFSTAAGAIVGGVVNCTINYLWTFRESLQSRRSVAFRYFLVWIGSIALNTYGTDTLVSHCSQWFDASLTIVMTAKAVVAVLVAVFWNFLLQKYFVYRA